MAIKTRKWILVADDDETFRRSTCDLLISHFGREIKIIEVEDGAQAVTKIRNQAFHLIVTDWSMPKKNGDEVIEAARNNMFNATTPIVVVSSQQTADIEKDFEFINFIAKPVDPFEFAQKVRNLFSIGSTEKMISASIFSSLLDASTRFLEEALKRSDFTIGEMQFKRRGESLTGDHAAIITVTVGQVTNTFSVLCSNQTLEALRSGSIKISGNSLALICKSLGYVILKHVLTECGIIDSNEVHAKDITQDPGLLTDIQGIVVPITADGINYKIFGTSQSEAA